MSGLKGLWLDNNKVVDVNTLAGVELIDNHDAGYTENGLPGFVSPNSPWLGNENPNAIGSNYRHHPAGTGSATASWEFTGLLPGQYQVQIAFPPHATRSSQAAYRVYDGVTLLTATPVLVEWRVRGPARRWAAARRTCWGLIRPPPATSASSSDPGSTPSPPTRSGSRRSVSPARA